MAKDSSFDVVSQVDMQEIDNAYGQTTKEMKQRYDLKGTNSKIDLDKRAKIITITAPSDFVVRQIVDILQSKLIKRGVDIKSVSWGKPENASGGNVRQVGTILEGIDRDTAGKINKDIKARIPKTAARIVSSLQVSATAVFNTSAPILNSRAREIPSPSSRRTSSS